MRRTSSSSSPTRMVRPLFDVCMISLPSASSMLVKFSLVRATASVRTGKHERESSDLRSVFSAQILPLCSIEDRSADRQPQTAARAVLPSGVGRVLFKYSVQVFRRDRRDRNHEYRFDRNSPHAPWRPRRSAGTTPSCSTALPEKGIAPALRSCRPSAVNLQALSQEIDQDLLDLPGFEIQLPRQGASICRDRDALCPRQKGRSRAAPGRRTLDIALCRSGRA